MQETEGVSLEEVNIGGGMIHAVFVGDTEAHLLHAFTEYERAYPFAGYGTERKGVIAVAGKWRGIILRWRSCD